MPETPKSEIPAHFKGKEAIDHVVEAQAKGLLSSTEIHGAEIPGHLSSGADAAREASIVLVLLWIILSHIRLSSDAIFQILLLFSLGWMAWKAGRSSWLAWSRLERMHRVVEQERWEIQHHRKQERDELKELYQAKGFEGQLLEDVVDVLMADDERLLKVMVEEELCLRVGTHEHPLKQALGGAIGTFFTSALCIVCFFFFPDYGIWIGGFTALSLASALSAYYEGNRMIPAITWNAGLAAICTGTPYFLLDYLTKS